ncbi:MAG: hypothetical protein NT099_01810 [Candidatus Saganbacteria bacterium]|nr:hypothetical protein [Candidatus Saganbacteria bacterium]
MAKVVFDLKDFAPHPRLVRHWTDAGELTPPPGLEKSRGFIQKEVKKAADHVPASANPLKTLIVGPAYFTDVPLKHLLERGRVVGVDVNLAAMEETRQDLTESEQPKLECLQGDASLFATRALETVETEIEHGSLDDRLFAAVYNSIGRTIQNLRTLRYPFAEGEFDTVVAMSTVTQLTMTFAAVLDDIFADKFGADPAFAFFNSPSPIEGATKGDLLHSLLSELNQRVFMQQFREFARMVKRGGVVFVSDHIFRALALGFNRTTATVNMQGIYPNSFMQQELNLRLNTKSTKLKVRVREKEGRILLSRETSLYAKVRKSRLTVLDRFCFWNLTDVDDATGTYELSLDEAIVATKA